MYIYVLGYVFMFLSIYIFTACTQVMNNYHPRMMTR